MDVLDSLKYPDKLIFDFTSNPINDNKNGYFSQNFVKSPFILFKKEYPKLAFPTPLNFSTADPIEAHLRMFHGVSENFVHFLIDNRTDQNYTENFTIPTQPNEILDLLSDMNPEKTKRFTVLFSFDTNYSTHKGTANFTRQIMMFTETFKNNWKHIRIGYMGDPDFVPISNLMDVIIISRVRGHYSTLFSAFSYSAIEQLLLQTCEESNINNLKLERQVYIIIKLPKHSTPFRDYLHFHKDERHRIYHLLLKSSVLWLNSGQKIGLVLQGFDKKTGSTPWFLNISTADYVVPLGFAYHSTEEFQHSACTLRTYMDKVTTMFKSVLQVREFVWSGTIDLDKKCILFNNTCREMCNHPVRRLSQSGKPLSWIIDGNDVETINKPLEQFINQTHNKLEGLSLETLIFNIFETEENKGILDKSVISRPNFLKNITRLFPKVSFACSWTQWEVPPRNYNFKDYKTLCNHYWDHVDLLIWEKTFRYVTNVFSIQKSRQQEEARYSKELVSQLLFTKKPADLYPEKKVILKLELNYAREQEHFSNLHCDSVIKFLNEQAEILMNFAQVFKFRIAFKPVFAKGGWWNPLRTVKELKSLANIVPFFTARNYPNSPLLLGGITTDPCVEITQEISQDGLQLDLDFFGTTFYFQINNFTTEEGLYNLFLLTCHKFSLIELFPKNKSDLLFLFQYLRKHSSQSVDQNDTKLMHLYLRIDCGLFLQVEDQLVLEINKTGIFAIHLAACEKIETDANWFVKSTAKTGLSLDNCIDHVLSQFKNITKLNIFTKLDYIVCNISTQENIESSNRYLEEVEKYLDTALYIKKYFHQLFPDKNLELIFRLNHHPVRVGNNDNNQFSYIEEYSEDNFTTKEFLKFLGDVSQYASLNKIKFFSVPAFDSEDRQRYGWWRITNFKSLENSSVLVEKESEFLGKDTWRPPVPNSVSNSTLQNLLTWSGVALVVLILLGALIVQYLKLRKYSYLSKQQVGSFLKGEHAESMEKLAFPKEFELQKKQILLWRGNFGMIYKGKLYPSSGHTASAQDILVAVKMPLPGCPKGSFMSLLSEIKVHCYVREHQNVLKFIGAYVKDIGRGEVYLVTEFCQNESLLEYLRKLNFTENYNQYELARFSHEICCGMNYLGSKKIIHGDLSARNILLDSNFTCKVADFGSSRKLYEYEQYVKKGEEPVPWRWMALESLKFKEFTIKSDIWSFGVTCWEIYSLGAIPYPCQGYNEEFLSYLENGNRLAKPTYATDFIYETMQNCWDTIPFKRPTFTLLVEFFISLRESNYSKVVGNLHKGNTVELLSVKDDFKEKEL